MIYHAFNRSAGRLRLFRTDADYQAFEDVLIEAHERVPIRILAWCVLPDRWQFVVWPRREGELSDFVRWLAHTHAIRWRFAHRSAGAGHLYQGRFKNFPVQQDEDTLLTLCRHVERAALTGKLVKRAERWRHSSLWASAHGPNELRAILSPTPVQRPRNWIERVNRPLTEKELARIKASVERGRPFGSDKWVQQTVKRLHMEHTVRPLGRPRKTPAGK